MPLKKLFWIANGVVVIGIIIVIIIVTRPPFVVDLTITCTDQYTNPIENAEISIDDDLIGNTDSNGQIKTRIKNVPRKGSKEVNIKIVKGEEYEEFNKTVEIPGNNDTFDLPITLTKPLKVIAEWVYYPTGQISPIPVVGGKVMLFDESGNPIKDGVTNSSGSVEFRFPAEKGVRIDCSTDSSDIYQQYPGMSSGRTERSPFFINDDEEYRITIPDNIVTRRVKYTIEMPDTISPSILASSVMKINGVAAVNINKKEATWEYQEEVYDGETKVVSISRTDYEFTPSSQTFKITKDKYDYKMVVTKVEYSPERTFKILCYDADNNLMINVDVMIIDKDNKVVSVPKIVNPDKSITVKKNLKNGTVKVNIKSKTNFKYTPADGQFSITSSISDYELVARETSQIPVKIKCYDQNGKGLASVNISSDEIKGITNDLGELNTFVEKSGTAKLTFSKGGYLTDNIELFIPKQGVVFNYYLWNGKRTPSYDITLGTWNDLSGRNQEEMVSLRRMTIDRLKREYGFSDGTKYTISGKLTIAEKGGRKLLYSSIYQQGELVASAEVPYGPTSNLQSVAGDLAESLMGNFPFEGVVLNASGTMKASIDYARNLQKGRELEIFKVTRDSNGKLSGNEGKIAEGEIVSSAGANVYIINTNKKGNISEGDWIRLKLNPPPGSLTVIVTDSKTDQPVDGMNIYYDEDEFFGGKTDQNGTTTFKVKYGKSYRVIGKMLDYETQPKNVTVKGNAETVKLSAVKPMFSLSISSDPSGCAVSINGNRIGTTPIKNYEIGGGNYIMTLVDNSGNVVNERTINPFIIPDKGSSEKFDALAISYNVSDRNVDVFVNMVVAYKQDRKNKVEAAIKNGNYQEAIDLLKPVSKKLTQDYANSRQKAGTIYANNLRDYNNAAEMFKQVISVERRYASAYYNLGYSYFNLKKYEEAIKSFDGVFENKMYLVKEDAPRIIHDTYYYKAQSYYKNSANTDNVKMACEQYFDNFDNQLKKTSEYASNSAYYDGCNKEIEGIYK
jgi:hypothetical protein